MTEIEIMPTKELWRVYDWNNGAAQGWDRDEYLLHLQRPDWVHYQIKKDGMIVGSVSLELMDAITVSFHVAVEPKRLKLKDMRSVLVGIGIQLFKYGIQRLATWPEKKNSAAKALALACGFRRMGEDGEHVFLGMTAQDYFNDPARWDGMIYAK